MSKLSFIYLILFVALSAQERFAGLDVVPSGTGSGTINSIRLCSDYSTCTAQMKADTNNSVSISNSAGFATAAGLRVESSLGYVNAAKFEVADPASPLGAAKWDLQASQTSGGLSNSNLRFRDGSGTEVMRLESYLAGGNVKQSLWSLHLYPNTTNTYSVGNSSARWLAYLHNADLDGAGQIDITGQIGTSDSIQSTRTHYRAFYAPNGGLNSRSVRANVYMQMGQSAGTPTATTSDTIVAGAFNYDTIANAPQYYNGSSWVGWTGACGSNTYVQFNDSGACGATADFTFNKTTKIATTTAGFTAGGNFTYNGATNGGFLVTNGTATGIMYASAVLTNSVVFGTVSNHPLVMYANNAFAGVIQPSGNWCIGCTADTYKLEVTGTAKISGRATVADIWPTTTDISNLGDPTKRFSSIYLANGIYMDGSEIMNSSRSLTNVVNITNSGYLTATGAITSNATILLSTTGDAYYDTGTGAFGDAGIHLKSNSAGKSWDVKSSGTTGNFIIRDVTNSADRMTITSAGDLQIPGTLNLANGATNGYFLTSDASGNATWAAVTACATCITTSGTTALAGSIVPNFAGIYQVGSAVYTMDFYGTLYGNISSSSNSLITGTHTPYGGSTYNLGSNGVRWASIYGNNVYAGTAFIGPSGGTGISGTKTIRASGGLSDCNLVYEGGIVTSTTC